MSDYRDGYVQAICEIGAIAYERAAKARYREGLAYEAGEYEKESFWHAVAVTAEMFYDYCQERLNKEDAE
ncbi:tryptophan halogenase [Bifidobacterium adolescentis]|uniref:Tryptophan halogenase n=1 Tax=Bifidobacterium adolescentis TaxID=1680 RepID=A0A1X2Z168_BIFAD|nr:tryptophan halogenase [Bifidobacterium adolescentis]OSG88134.1 tryptophan halogenase [Bifidobacterium adolescentis]